MSIKAKTNSLLAHLLALVLFPKNLNNWSMTKSGCSSGIQCPESGTVTPFTFAASACVEFNAKFPGNHHLKQGKHRHLIPIQALLS